MPSLRAVDSLLSTLIKNDNIKDSELHNLITAFQQLESALNVPGTDNTDKMEAIKKNVLEALAEFEKAFNSATAPLQSDDDISVAASHASAAHSYASRASGLNQQYSANIFAAEQNLKEFKQAVEVAYGVQPKPRRYSFKRAYDWLRGKNVLSTALNQSTWLDLAKSKLLDRDQAKINITTKNV